MNRSKPNFNNILICRLFFFTSNLLLLTPWIKDSLCSSASLYFCHCINILRRQLEEYYWSRRNPSDLQDVESGLQIKLQRSGHNQIQIFPSPPSPPHQQTQKVQDKNQQQLFSFIPKICLDPVCNSFNLPGIFFLVLYIVIFPTGRTESEAQF